jgi:predicted RecB family nuclease
MRHAAGVQRLGDELVLSPTDLTKHLACPHITTLDLLRLDGGAAPAATDDALELIFKLGLAHEEAYLQVLRDQGRSVMTIGAATRDVTRAQREQETVEAMRSGVDVVYQGTFFDGSWGGQADFLLRGERPSSLGTWSYDIADTKLARKLKVPALLQMAAYAERLTILQGLPPANVSVVTGDGQVHPWRLVDVAAFARRARARLREAVELQPATAPVPVGHCGQCRWIERCDRQWREDDDLSLVAFMRGDHRQVLREHGITTLAQLGTGLPEELPREIGRVSRERLVHQASLQLWERQHKEVRYDLLEPVAGMGLLRLPPPDAGDLYLDFEGDPYAEGGEGREYLAGIGDRAGAFTSLWAHSRAAEKQLTVDLVDRLLARWQEHPEMHVYHYAPYETTALKRLVSRHGVREAELDQLLRGERFVDLYAVVRQGMRISKGSYSIKKMEAFYWGHIRNNNPDVADAMSSVIAYERWSEQPDDTTLPQIEAYNRDDVRSTQDLHDWLEQRRTELERTHGTQLRPADQPTDPATPPGAPELAEIALAERLQAAGEPLLAGLVQFHRREARPAYWEMFRLEDLDEDELVDDSAALGSLSTPRQIGTIARSKLYRYDFPPQDTKLKRGDTAYDVDDRKPAGTVHELDAEAGYVVLKRQATARLCRGFTEKQVLSDQVIRTAIAAVGDERLAGRPCLGSALLDRVVPPVLTDVVSAGLALDGQVLAVQGPPGSGKTTVGAELIRALLDAGKRVGITANSHAVVGGFLDKVGRPGVQRCTGPDDFCGAPGISQAGSTADVVGALAGGAQLVGGTAWLWSDPAMAASVDVLVVDEAGQFSLANAVGVSRAATSMVLLGDPQQLAQPTRALHPDGAGVSALGHLLDGHETIPPSCGIFLGTTWRMHPSITSYVSDLAYDGRLGSTAGLERQAIGGQAGLRIVEVPHIGNAAASREEVAVVAKLWTSLVGSVFTDRHGVDRPMTGDDVLVVTPYNNQVGLLRQALPGARVGTVDKFQGQQAPVVVYSMTSSSAQDAPRGIDFLYDLHRLNVAVSRAQAMAVVVMSPRLLEAAVHTPEQLRAVNALCRLREIAGDWRGTSVVPVVSAGTSGIGPAGRGLSPT